MNWNAIPNHSRFLPLIVCLFLLSSPKAQTYKVATYNVRYDNRNDAGNLWKNRVCYIASLIRYHDFDLLGTQEALPHQLKDLQSMLPYFDLHGKGRDDGANKGEHSAIFYKKEKFELLDTGDFWLSQTPEKPGLGWDATCCNRICSWVYLKDKKSKKKFYFFNTHFDHEGQTARKESSKLVLKKIQEMAKGTPVILTGDFNAGRNTEPYQIISSSHLIRDAYKDVPYPYENNTSFNGFQPGFEGTEIIDHIFVSSHWQATRWGVLTDTYFGKFPSDHFPVSAVLHMK